MGPRRFFSIALHLLLAVGLVLPGIAAPAQAASQLLASASGMPDAMSHSSCDAMAMQGGAPAKGLPASHHECNLAGCLGAGCLPRVAHVAAFVPATDNPVAFDQPVPPSQLPDTLLRPPIA